MRKKKQEAPENHERWLVSYADFITLLFAFFVVMFASSQTDKGKAQQIQESVRRAIDEGQVASAIAGILGGVPDDKGKGSAQMKGPGGEDRLSKDKKPEGKVAEFAPAAESLTAQLAAEIAAGQIQVTLEARGLVISFQQAAFFPSGGDEIPPETYGSIEKVAAIMRQLPNPVRLEGHTDSLPLRTTARFRSNWELSAARAIAMMELLVACCEIPRERLSIAGYAENAPVSDNHDETGRRRNRRVDIVILSQTGVSAEPTAAAQKVREGSAGHASSSPKPKSSHH